MKRTPFAALALGVIAAAGLQAVVLDEVPRSSTPRGPAPKRPDAERLASAEAKRQRKAAKRLAAIKEQPNDH